MHQQVFVPRASPLAKQKEYGLFVCTPFCITKTAQGLTLTLCFHFIQDPRNNRDNGDQVFFALPPMPNNEDKSFCHFGRNSVYRLTIRLSRYRQILDRKIKILLS